MNTPLTQQQTEAMIAEYASGVSRPDLAKKYDVSIKTVKRKTKGIKKDGTGDMTPPVPRDMTPPVPRDKKPPSLPPGYDADKERAQEKRNDLKEAICRMLDAGEDIEYIIKELDLMPGGCHKCRAEKRRQKELEQERLERQAKRDAEPMMTGISEVGGSLCTS